MVMLLAVALLPLSGVAGTLSPKTPPPPPTKAQTVSPLTTLYLTSWGSSISQQGSSAVLLSGYSEADVPVNQIWVTLYWQQWNGSQWVTISAGYQPTGYDTTSVTGQETVNVTPGYYYRAMGQHQVYNNGIYDPSQPEVSTSADILVE
jgi:hypothetical protein